MTDRGRYLEYDRLLLASGSDLAVPPIENWGVPGCSTLRDVDDAMAVRDFVNHYSAQQAVVLGGGLLGLEAAYSLRKHGLRTTVIDRNAWIMHRQVDAECGEILHGILDDLDIHYITGSNIKLVTGTDRLTAIELEGGQLMSTDLLLASTGITPSVGLATGAGLEEPLSSEEVGAYKRLSDRVEANNIPLKIAGGEGADFYRSADDLMTNGGIDFVQIDVGRIGGITPADRVCHRAQELGIQYVNHTFKSHLTVAASIHVFAGVEEFDLVEYPAGDSPFILGMTAPTGIFRDKNGMVSAADTPGLGVEANLDTLRTYLRRVRIELDGKLLYESPEP